MGSLTEILLLKFYKSVAPGDCISVNLRWPVLCIHLFSPYSQSATVKYIVYMCQIPAHPICPGSSPLCKVKVMNAHLKVTILVFYSWFLFSEF